MPNVFIWVASERLLPLNLADLAMMGGYLFINSRLNSKIVVSCSTLIFPRCEVPFISHLNEIISLWIEEREIISRKSRTRKTSQEKVKRCLYRLTNMKEEPYWTTLNFISNAVSYILNLITEKRLLERL